MKLANVVLPKFVGYVVAIVIALVLLKAKLDSDETERSTAALNHLVGYPPP